MTTTPSYTYLLKISNVTALNEFLHDCVDDLLQKRRVSFEKYSSGDIEWTEEDFIKARTYVQNMYRQSVIDNNLELPKDVTSDLQEAISRCYKIRKGDIFQALAKECVLQKNHNLVENIDWRLKWILGSSDLVTLQEPALQVDFYCSQKSGNETVRNLVNFEANFEQVDKLISDLTNIQKELH